MTGPSGQLRVVERLEAASNATFLAEDDAGIAWVYKPMAGEAPLHDFPRGTLGRREVAAYALSEALTLAAIPETCWCHGPLGEGSAQRWVEGEPTGLVAVLPPEQITELWHPILLAQDQQGSPLVLAHQDDPRLRQVALLDVLLNNADRKGSHLIQAGERIWAVDHGISLHLSPKLRTILWGWATSEFSPREQAVLMQAAKIETALSPGLTGEEWAAVAQRAKDLLRVGMFPAPEGTWRDIPWPPL